MTEPLMWTWMLGKEGESTVIQGSLMTSSREEDETKLAKISSFWGETENLKKRKNNIKKVSDINYKKLSSFYYFVLQGLFLSIC